MRIAVSTVAHCRQCCAIRYGDDKLTRTHTHTHYTSAVHYDISVLARLSRQQCRHTKVTRKFCEYLQQLQLALALKLLFIVMCSVVIRLKLHRCAVLCPVVVLLLCRRPRKFEKSDCWLHHVCLSGHSHLTDFHEILYFENLSKKNSSFIKI